MYASACKESPKSQGTDEAKMMLTDQDYLEIGSAIAKSTQAELGKNLMGAMQKEGPLGALEFCNLQAYPLTDSMGEVHNAQIRRVSDKARNQNNQANTLELEHIAHFKELVAADREYKPIIKQTNGKVVFFSPIITNAMCLQCHGKPDMQIQPATLAKIEALYPEDQATGYDVNQVRGIWSIEFDAAVGM